MKETEKEREMIRATAAKTAQRIVQPRAAEIDATGEFPWDLVDAFGKQGLLSIILPEEYGGSDGNITSFCFVIEEIAKVCGSSSLLILAQGIGTLPIWLGGNPSQKELYFSLPSPLTNRKEDQISSPSRQLLKSKGGIICSTAANVSLPMGALPNFTLSLPLLIPNGGEKESPLS
jgi:hypothetical protein